MASREGARCSTSEDNGEEAAGRTERKESEMKRPRRSVRPSPLLARRAAFVRILCGLVSIQTIAILQR